MITQRQLFNFDCNFIFTIVTIIMRMSIHKTLQQN